MAKSDFGKGSKKRKLAAEKAARTRKRNAELKNKQKTTKPSIKTAKGKFHHKVASFIEKNLVTKIINDCKHNLISSEADLQSSIYFHLRVYFHDYENIRISSELSIRTKKKAKDIRVDIVISKIIHTFAQMEPLVAIELKEHQEVGPDLLEDIKKLQKLREKKIIKYGYMIYLCRSQYSQKQLQNEADGFVKTKYKERVIPIIINIYNYMNGVERTTFDRRWEQTKRYELSKATAKKQLGLEKEDSVEKGNKKFI